MTDLARATPIGFVITADRARAKPFYTEVLALPVLAEDDFALTLGLAAGASVRLTTLADHRPQGHTVLGWAVPDIAAAVIALKAKGVAFQVYEGFGQDDNAVWTAPGGGAKVAWFTDPDGNILSLTEFG